MSRLTVGIILGVLWVLCGSITNPAWASRAGRAQRWGQGEGPDPATQITLPQPDPATLLPVTPAYLSRPVETPPSPPAPPVAIDATVGTTAPQPSATAASSEAERASDQKTDQAAQGSPQAAANGKHPFPAAVLALRDPVRRMLAQQQAQPFNTHDSLPGEIMDFCLAYGCRTEVSLGGAGGKKLNGITCLCWNYPCASFEMLRTGPGHLVARVGYGCQEYPGEFLATLALSSVPATYPIRVGRDERTVADLVAGEQLSCRTRSNMSLKLIGLSYYVEAPSWKNELGEEWSLERVIQQEIAQPVVSAPDGGLNRLMGLAYTVRHRLEQGLPIEGQYLRAQKYVDDFLDFALRLENSDGTWGPYLLAAHSASSDPLTQLWATGRVTEWLAMSLPEGRLTEPRVVRALEQVLRLLDNQRYQGNVAALSTQEIGAFAHALHALAVYDQRVFQPIDAAEKAAAEKAAAEKAAAEKAAAEKAAADAAALKKAAAEKAAAEKAAAEKAAHQADKEKLVPPKSAPE